MVPDAETVNPLRFPPGPALKMKRSALAGVATIMVATNVAARAPQVRTQRPTAAGYTQFERIRQSPGGPGPGPNSGAAGSPARICSGVPADCISS